MIEKRLPMILVMLFVFSYFFSAMLPGGVKSFFYATSLTIQEVLLFILPFIIISFLFEGIVSLRMSSALKFVLFIIPSIMVSGFIALQISYFMGKLLFMKGAAIIPMVHSGNTLEPLWNFSLPKILSTNYALMIGVGLGFLFPILDMNVSRQFSRNLSKEAMFLLQKIFIPVIPLFIFGFLLRIEHDGYLERVVKDYLWIFLYVIVLAYSYITLLYFIGANLHIKRFVFSIKNMIPALITGFSTMSSAMAMPFLIKGVEKSVPNPETGHAVVPVSINPHLLGDAFGISLFAFGILLSFGHEFPSFETYVVFSIYLLISKFSVAGIPGGGVLVLAPILGEHLGFDATMVSLITAVYILFDPFITAANVYGNGAFAILFSKLFERPKKI